MSSVRRRTGGCSSPLKAACSATSSTVTSGVPRAWLPAADAASSLARRPYDLRHAAVSTWLNAGVDPTLVAAWAGHSVQVLLQVYAKCIVGRDEIARRRIEAALGLEAGTPIGP